MPTNSKLLSHFHIDTELCHKDIPVRNTYVISKAEKHSWAEPRTFRKASGRERRIEVSYLLFQRSEQGTSVCLKRTQNAEVSPCLKLGPKWVPSAY